MQPSHQVLSPGEKDLNDEKEDLIKDRKKP